MRWSVTEEPTIEPLTVGEVMTRLRYEPSDTDHIQTVTDLIRSARKWAEQHMEMAIMDQEITVHLDGFPSGRSYRYTKGTPDSRILLPIAGLTAITEITYDDQDGASQTLSTDIYAADAYSRPSAVVRKASQSWPSTYDQANAVQIVYRAGAETRDSVPAHIKQALHLLIAHWDENRAAASAGVTVSRVPLAVESLLGQSRVLGV